MKPIPARLLPHTVVVQPVIGDSGDGLIYGPPVEHPARVDYSRTLTRDRNGAEAVSEAAVLLRPGTGCDVQARLTLPDGTRAVILGVKDAYDAHKPVVTEVVVA